MSILHSALQFSMTDKMGQHISAGSQTEQLSVDETGCICQRSRNKGFVINNTMYYVYTYIYEGRSIIYLPE
jgi:hypothetical protein